MNEVTPPRDHPLSDLPGDPPWTRLFKRTRYFVSTRFMLRARFLFFLPLPLFFSGLYSAFTGDAINMLGRWGGLSLLLLAAWLLLNGLKAENAYNERAVAKPPVIPRKLFAAVTTGIGVAVTALFGFTPVMQEPMTAVVYALLSCALYLASFGLDPMRAKGLDGLSKYESQRLIEALEVGESLLDDTVNAARTFPKIKLQRQVTDLVSEARQVFRAIERDPRDLPRSRKFMSVYLQGARDATVKLAQLQIEDARDPAFDEYQQLLQDLHLQFVRQKHALLENDRSDLDVEVEVLRERINQER